MLHSNSDSPAAHYRAARAEAAARLAVVEQRDARLSNARLVVFLAGLVYAWGLWHGWPAAGLLAPVAGFVVLVVWHARVRAAQAPLRHLLEVYDEGLARLEGRWAGKGPDGADLVPPHHPYAEDVDIAGPGSLFELLCTCRTRMGEEQLAAWLLGHCGAAEAQARAEAVRELATLHAPRVASALAGRPERVARPRADFASWAAAPERFRHWGWALLAGGAVGLTLIGVVIAWLANLYAPLVALFAVNLVVLAGLRPRTAALERWAEASERQWRILAELMRVLENGVFQSARLRALQAAVSEPEKASNAFRRLDTLAYLLQMPANQFFLPIAVWTLWPLIFSLGVERWRRRFGPRFGPWLDALAEFEALCALGTFAYEHPDYSFPEWHAETAFRAEGLAHPLLPSETRVANDVYLGPGQRLLLVSGSNMSGKSTLMRSIGINTVLAMAGAPVCARRLALCPVALGATMRVHDSIQEGASRFYAEVLRLRQLLDLARGDTPLLFLCDEILHGTNSHDRLEGARALMRAFQEAGALGAMTTHDLALTALASELDAAVNVHLQDTFDGERLVFDYTLRPGVVSKSNALALMRRAGLPI